MPALFDPAIVVRGGAAPPVPHIASIDPASALRITHPLLGVTVTLTGSGFDAGSVYANHLVFSGSATPIPDRITAATATQITATFHVEDVPSGQQSVPVVTSSLDYSSNAVNFDVE